MLKRNSKFALIPSIFEIAYSFLPDGYVCPDNYPCFNGCSPYPVLATGVEMSKRNNPNESDTPL